MRPRVFRYIIIILITLLTATSPIYQLIKISPRNQFTLSFEAIFLISIPTAITFASLTLAEIRYTATDQSYIKRLEKVESNFPRAIKHLFKNRSLGTNENLDNIRANIMKPGHVITFESKRLRIRRGLKMVATYNFEPWVHKGERDLVWQIGKGACGHALFRADEFQQDYRWSPVIYDKAKASADALKSEWNLPEKYLSLTDHIDWVISIPIVLYQEDNENPIFLGILNIDGTEPLKNKEILTNKEFHLNCKAWGANFGIFFRDADLVTWMRRTVFLR